MSLFLISSLPTNIVKQYDTTFKCGLVWTSNFVAYRCRTCAISLCMSLCANCFLNGDHTGHDFNMFRSPAGGACDCGDSFVMKPSGFCKDHKLKINKNCCSHDGTPKSKSATTASQAAQPPNSLVCMPMEIVPKLLQYLVNILRENNYHRKSSIE